MQTFVVLIAAIFLAQFAFAGETKPPHNPAWRDLNTHHCFTPPPTKKEWEARAAELRRQVLFSAGLYPMPEKTPLNPRVTGKFDGGDFTVENIALETFPGFFLCGNLYRPKNLKGPFPAIVNPHGHWANGRLQIEEDVPKAEPAPAKPAKGAANLVSIGVNLARQGFVVFAYDMIGYNDTIQIPKHREFALGLQPWLWNVSLNGMQLWNSIRAVDYVASLPDVDPERIGATGASGGGTQTFQLCAVDERIKCAVPVNMVSAHMQGGCLCENAPGMRVGTDNPELAAVFAPRPLLLVAATGDWTKNNPTEEWPAIRKVYEFYKSAEKTDCKQFNYGHNYNVESREAMYAWFGRWLLKDTNAEHFREKPFTLDTKSMHVWNDANPLPANALKDTDLIKALINRSEEQFTAAMPHKHSDLKSFAESACPALATSLSVNLSDKRAISTPTFAIKPDPDAKDVTLVVALREKQTEAESLVKALSTKKSSAALLVLESKPMTQKELWDEFFTCYNRTPLGDSVQQIVDAFEGLQRAGARHLSLVALGDAGVPAVLARGLHDEEIRAVVDLNHFNSNDDEAFLKTCYAPGLRRAGDIRAALLLGSNAPLSLFNADSKPLSQVLGCTEALKAPVKALEKPPAPDEIVNLLNRK